MLRNWRRKAERRGVGGHLFTMTVASIRPIPGRTGEKCGGNIGSNYPLVGTIVSGPGHGQLPPALVEANLDHFPME